MYNYLTGSASWLLLTVLTETFGVKGLVGDIVFQPKLVKEQFDRTGKASVKTSFANRKLNIIYQLKEVDQINCKTIESVNINGKQVLSDLDQSMVKLPRHLIEELAEEDLHTILVVLK